MFDLIKARKSYCWPPRNTSSASLMPRWRGPGPIKHHNVTICLSFNPFMHFLGNNSIIGVWSQCGCSTHSAQYVGVYSPKAHAARHNIETSSSSCVTFCYIGKSSLLTRVISATRTSTLYNVMWCVGNSECNYSLQQYHKLKSSNQLWDKWQSRMRMRNITIDIYGLNLCKSFGISRCRDVIGMCSNITINRWLILASIRTNRGLGICLLWRQTTLNRQSRITHTGGRCHWCKSSEAWS